VEKLGYMEVGWHGLLVGLAKLIEAWRAPYLSGEVAYRDELFNYIRAAIPRETRLEKEYRHNGTTVDIWIRWKGFFFDGEVSLELKVDLTKKTEFDRLVGQIEAIEPKANKILVVLIGDCDSALVGRLREKYCPPGYALNEPERFRIVCVPIENNGQ
jgi:hypothetical protein